MDDDVKLKGQEKEKPWFSVYTQRVKQSFQTMSTLDELFQYFCVCWDKRSKLQRRVRVCRKKVCVCVWTRSKWLTEFLSAGIWVSPNR